MEHLKTLKLVLSILDVSIEKIGKAASWMVLMLVLIVTYDVAMRYLLNSGSIAIQEFQWHLFSLIFLVGAAYTLKHDDHVRLDMLYHSQWVSDRGRAWINLLGSVCMLAPFCMMVIIASDTFVIQSWQFQEHSPDPGGLRYRWLIKSAIPLSFILLLIQAIHDALSNFLIIIGENE